MAEDVSPYSQHESLLASLFLVFDDDDEDIRLTSVTAREAVHV